VCVCVREREREREREKNEKKCGIGRKGENERVEEDVLEMVRGRKREIKLKRLEERSQQRERYREQKREREGGGKEGEKEWRRSKRDGEEKKACEGETI